MTHIRLDDGFGEHPKIVGLSDGAYRLYVNGLCYCSRRETDGAIPFGALAVRAKTATELIDAHLWEDDAGGWRVHDYLSHQRSREQINAQKTATKRRLDRFRNGVTSENETRQRERVRVRGANAPREEEDPTAAAAARSSAREVPPLLPLDEDDARRAIKAWERQSPAGLNKTIIDKLDLLLMNGTSIEYIEAACERAGEAGGRKPWNYVLSIIERMKTQGSTADTRPKSNPNSTSNNSAMILDGQAVSSHLGGMTAAEKEAATRWDEEHAEELAAHRKRRHG